MKPPVMMLPADTTVMVPRGVAEPCAWPTPILPWFQPYTLAEVYEHNTADDCWMAIDGKEGGSGTGAWGATWSLGQMGSHGVTDVWHCCVGRVCGAS